MNHLTRAILDSVRTDEVIELWMLDAPEDGGFGLLQPVLRGGAIYDYLHPVTARQHHADHLYTLNTSHFQSFWRDGDPAIVHP